MDGEKFPSWYGTGSEDYLGDAWGTRMFHNPSHGFPQHKEHGWLDGDLVGCYRWHLGDNIPFYKSFFMTIENYEGRPDVEIRNDYSSVAYWYQIGRRVYGSDYWYRWALVRRIVLARRGDSLLVRIAVPVDRTQELPSSLSAVAELGPPLYAALADTVSE